LIIEYILHVQEFICIYIHIFVLFHSVVKISAINPDEVAFNFIAIVDPVSRGAQKLGPILKTLQQALNCNIKVFLNCVDKNSDMPLKR